MDVIHSSESQMFLKIARHSPPVCKYLWIHVRQKTLHVCQLSPPSGISDMRLLHGEMSVPYQGRNTFHEMRVHTSLPLLTLPLTRSYLLPAAETCPIPLHSWVPTWAVPVPAVEKHPLLGQEHPALLESPGRAGSRAGCECEERTMNSTIPMAWTAVKALRALQQAPGSYTYICILQNHWNTQPYCSLSTLDLSTKCTLGDWFLRNVTLDPW